MFGMGMPEVVAIGVIVFLLFGPKMLPKLARGMGEAIKETRKAAKEIAANLEDEE